MTRIDQMFPPSYVQTSYNVGMYYRKVVYGVMWPLTLFTIGAVIIVITMPSVASFINFLKTGEFTKRLPFLIWYPLDVNTTFVYILVFIHQFYAGFIAGMSLLLSDLLLCYMTLQICMQFTGLSSRLKEMRPIGSRLDLLQLILIIQQHDMIIKITDDVNEIFRVAILINFLSACGIICFAGFQIKEGGAEEVIRYILNLIFISVQVFILSFVGQTLSNCSQSVGDAAYEQSWLDSSESYKKSLLLIMQRSKVPSTIRGFTRSSVDLQNFRDVILNGYRFFTLLNTIYVKSA